MKPTSTVIILCGGSGRRLHGTDKPLLSIAGTPIIARLCRELKSVGPILISANRNLSSYRRYGEVVPDTEKGLGPLAGLAATLDHCRSDTVFVCPGDCPDVTAALARRLLEPLSVDTGGDQRPQAVVAHDGERLQNLHLALRTEVRTGLSAYLAAGGRSAHGWLAQLPSVTEDCRDLASAFADIDTEEELAARQR